jgi:capsular exopolysaccharide synthesis family protein
MAVENNNCRKITDQYDGESAAGTEFRRLLHNLLNSSYLPENGKSFLVTSATTGEGKSTIASSLAITASIYKTKKTLLIDCDVRRPVLHKFFGHEREGGLSDAILDEMKLEDNLKSTPIENLWLLTSGTHHPNPTHLLDSPRLPELLAAAKFYFELVIIDCAPVIPVSDALVLGREADGVVLVVKAGETPREVSKRATSLIHESGANLLGVTLNNVKDALPYYYNYRYYGYRYSSKP